MGKYNRQKGTQCQTVRKVSAMADAIKAMKSHKVYEKKCIASSSEFLIKILQFPVYGINELLSIKQIVKKLNVSLLFSGFCSLKGI
jgi:hypothetical protein